MARTSGTVGAVLLCVVVSCAQQLPRTSPPQQVVVSSQNALPQSVSCTAEKPVVLPKEAIHVRLWMAQSGGARQYVWTATGGHIEGQGTTALWDFTDAQPGYYNAIVRYPDVSGTGTCTTQVVVEEGSGGRGSNRETGHDLLVKNSPEGEGYGLYSYVLLSAPPDDNSRERCLKLMEAFLQKAPAIADLEKYFDHKQLNITYVPVDASPRTPPSAQWLLDHYDYARARFLMHGLPGSHAEGPYIVSSLQPLGKAEAASSGPCLSQDLSSVPPHLVSLWVNEFFNQAAQERFWEENSGKKLTLKLRTAIGILAAGLPDVRKGLDDWVSWTH